MLFSSLASQQNRKKLARAGGCWRVLGPHPGDRACPLTLVAGGGKDARQENNRMSLGPRPSERLQKGKRARVQPTSFCQVCNGYKGEPTWAGTFSSLYANGSNASRGWEQSRVCKDASNQHVPQSWLVGYVWSANLRCIRCSWLVFQLFPLWKFLHSRERERRFLLLRGSCGREFRRKIGNCPKKL